VCIAVHINVHTSMFTHIHPLTTCSSHAQVLNHTDLAYSNPYKCFSIPLRPPTTTTTSSTTTRQEEEEEKSTHANWNSSVFSRSSTSSRPTSAQKYVSLHEASMRCQAACSTEGPDPAAKAAAAQAHRQHRQHLSSSGWKAVWCSSSISSTVVVLNPVG